MLISDASAEFFQKNILPKKFTKNNLYVGIFIVVNQNLLNFPLGIDNKVYHKFE